MSDISKAINVRVSQPGLAQSFETLNHVHDPAAALPHHRAEGRLRQRSWCREAWRVPIEVVWQFNEMQRRVWEVESGLLLPFHAEDGTLRGIHNSSPWCDDFFASILFFISFKNGRRKNKWKHRKEKKKRDILREIVKSANRPVQREEQTAARLKKPIRTQRRTSSRVEEGHPSGSFWASSRQQLAQTTFDKRMFSSRKL